MAKEHNYVRPIIIAIVTIFLSAVAGRIYDITTTIRELENNDIKGEQVVEDLNNIEVWSITIDKRVRYLEDQQLLNHGPPDPVNFPGTVTPQSKPMK